MRLTETGTGPTSTNSQQLVAMASRVVARLNAAGEDMWNPLHVFEDFLPHGFSASSDGSKITEQFTAGIEAAKAYVLTMKESARATDVARWERCEAQLKFFQVFYGEDTIVKLVESSGELERIRVEHQELRKALDDSGGDPSKLLRSLQELTGFSSSTGNGTKVSAEDREAFLGIIEYTLAARDRAVEKLERVKDAVQPGDPIDLLPMEKQEVVWALGHDRVPGLYLDKMVSDASTESAEFQRLKDALRNSFDAAINDSVALMDEARRLLAPLSLDPKDSMALMVSVAVELDGPAGLQTVQRRIDEVTFGELRALGIDVRPEYFSGGEANRLELLRLVKERRSQVDALNTLGVFDETTEEGRIDRRKTQRLASIAEQMEKLLEDPEAWERHRASTVEVLTESYKRLLRGLFLSRLEEAVGELKGGLSREQIEEFDSTIAEYRMYRGLHYVFHVEKHHEFTTPAEYEAACKRTGEKLFDAVNVRWFQREFKDLIEAEQIRAERDSLDALRDGEFMRGILGDVGKGIQSELAALGVTPDRLNRKFTEFFGNNSWTDLTPLRERTARAAQVLCTDQERSAYFKAEKIIEVVNENRYLAKRTLREMARIKEKKRELSRGDQDGAGKQSVIDRMFSLLGYNNFEMLKRTHKPVLGAVWALSTLSHPVVALPLGFAAAFVGFSPFLIVPGALGAAFMSKGWKPYEFFDKRAQKTHELALRHYSSYTYTKIMNDFQGDKTILEKADSVTEYQIMVALDLVGEFNHRPRWPDGEGPHHLTYVERVCFEILRSRRKLRFVDPLLDRNGEVGAKEIQEMMNERGVEYARLKALLFGFHNPGDARKPHPEAVARDRKVQPLYGLIQEEERELREMVSALRDPSQRVQLEEFLPEGADLENIASMLERSGIEYEVTEAYREPVQKRVLSFYDGKGPHKLGPWWGGWIQYNLYRHRAERQSNAAVHDMKTRFIWNPFEVSVRLHRLANLRNYNVSATEEASLDRIADSSIKDLGMQPQGQIPSVQELNFEREMPLVFFLAERGAKKK